MTFDKEIERMKSVNRRPATRPLPGEKRTVVDFRQESAVATVTMLVEIPRGGATSRSYSPALVDPMTLAPSLCE